MKHASTFGRNEYVGKQGTADSVVGGAVCQYLAFASSAAHPPEARPQSRGEARDLWARVNHAPRHGGLESRWPGSIRSPQALRMSDARAAVHHGGLGEEPQWQFRRIGARQALASRSHRALFGAAVRMWRAVANE